MPFALDFSGETVFLTAATADVPPKPLRVLDAMRYDVTEPEVTFGRFPDGSLYLGCLSSATRGAANAKPLVRDIVINEIMYNHAMRDDQYEYVELYNRGTRPVSLAGWAFTDGIEYSFGSGAVMQPGSYLVVAKDPNFLAALYSNLTIGTNLVGPYVGTLDNHSERIRLSFPVQGRNPADGQAQSIHGDRGRSHLLRRRAMAEMGRRHGRQPRVARPAQQQRCPRRLGRQRREQQDNLEISSPSAPTAATPNSRHDTVTIFDLMMLNGGRDPARRCATDDRRQELSDQRRLRERREPLANPRQPHAILRDYGGPPAARGRCT